MNATRQVRTHHLPDDSEIDMKPSVTVSICGQGRGKGGGKGSEGRAASLPAGANREQEGTKA